MFEELVGLIDKIKDDSIGEWIVDKENDGTLEHPMQMPFVVYSSALCVCLNRLCMALKKTTRNLNLTDMVQY